ncbi:hypothetical protein ACFQUU_16910 [Herbaspirillum sp. GCM10030257]|uniref:hypothetical protein n=1 Tax=Herbaspirillum sp. GCM10030257 TaxID=3273393 RepID=UPI00360CFB81
MKSSIGLMTELYTHEVPYVFAEFKRLVGESYWVKRVKALKEHLRGQPSLRDFLREENRLAFLLADCSKVAFDNGGMLPLQATTRRELYPAFAFMAQTLSIINSADDKNAQAIIARIRGGMKNPPDLRAMDLELHTANHFVSRGYHVEWPEMTKSGTFDLLVPDLGNGGLEVECKSISSDKGRSVHRRDAMDFFHLVGSDVKAACLSMDIGLAIVLTVPARLPSQQAEKRELAKRVTSALVGCRTQQFPDRVTVRISEFNPADLNVVHNQGKPTVEQNDVDKVTGTVNQESMIIGTPAGGIVALVVQSAEDDELLQSVFTTLSDSAKRQLTGQRAGIFFAGFADLTPEQMIALAQHDVDASNAVTALRQGVSRFLGNAGRDHVIGVSFLSQSHLTETEPDVVTSRGSAYYFPRKESKFWHNDFEGLVRTFTT